MAVARYFSLPIDYAITITQKSVLIVSPMSLYNNVTRCEYLSHGFVSFLPSNNILKNNLNDHITI
jgi:hypothetical protein